MTQTKKASKEMTLMHYWRVIAGRMWVVLIPAVIVPLTVLISSLATDQVYRASGTLRMRDSEEMFAWKDQSIKLSTELEIIKSKVVLEGVVEKIRGGKEFQKFSGLSYLDKDLEDLDKKVKAKKLGREVNIIEVSVDSRDPELARDMTNVLMASVIQHNLAYKRREAEQTRLYIEKQQDVVSKKLMGAEARLGEFQKRNKRIDMKMHIETPYMDPLSVIDPLAKIEGELMPVREKVASLSKLYTKDYPELQQARAELAVREGYRRKLIDQMDKLPEIKTEYVKYLRDSEIYQKDYENLALAAQKARLDEVGVVSDFSIVDEARMPRFPVYPKTVLSTVTGALVGVMLGLFMAFFLEYLDRTIKDPGEVEGRLAVPLLGEIPYIDLAAVQERALQKAGAVARMLSGSPTQDAETTSISERLVSHLAPKSMAAESYRQLFINMSYAHPDGEIRTLAVSSPGAAEGKSNVAVNLAMVGASLGKKVLLVDGDMRKPMVHKIFSFEGEPGLGNVMREGLTLKELVRETGIDNFSVITAGHIPPAPMLLFNSARFVSLVEEMRDTFDIVIFDTPPINGMADTPTLASKVEGLLMVVSQGQTEHEAALHAKQLLTNVNARIIGVVMNCMSAGAFHGYSYDRYGYSYYGADRKGNQSILKRISKVAAKNGVLKRLFKTVTGDK